LTTAIAVCLRFDEQTTGLVEQIWRSLGSDMLDLGYPPHLTLIIANDYAEVGDLVQALPRIAGRVPALVELGNPRAFPNSEVTYLPCSGDLSALHQLVADLVPFHTLHEHYRPETWTPHVTLQTRGNTGRALDVAGDGWLGLDAVPVALELITFPPVAVHSSLSVGQR
jgi:2'-5' RNA ligase